MHYTQFNLAGTHELALALIGNLMPLLLMNEQLKSNTDNLPLGVSIDDDLISFTDQVQADTTAVLAKVFMFPEDGVYSGSHHAPWVGVAALGGTDFVDLVQMVMEQTGLSHLYAQTLLNYYLNVARLVPPGTYQRVF